MRRVASATASTDRPSSSSRMTNSSPPTCATASRSRMAPRSRAPTACSSTSPPRRPNATLTWRNWVMSSRSTATSRPVAGRLADQPRQAPREPRAAPASRSTASSPADTPGRRRRCPRRPARPAAARGDNATTVPWRGPPRSPMTTIEARTRAPVPVAVTSAASIGTPSPASVSAPSSAEHVVALQHRSEIAIQGAARRSRPRPRGSCSRCAPGRRP